MPKIKIYYDNKSVSKDVKAAWGFSALVKHNNRNILFDTGGNAETLKANLKAMGSDPEYFESVVISHEHWDHITALSEILRLDQKIYLLGSFSDKLKSLVKGARADLIEIKGFQQIFPDVYTTGEMGEAIREQSLIVTTPKGLIILTGCSHPGIVEIVRKAKETLKRDVYFVIGGFHLGALDARQVEKIAEELKALGVKKIAPCHCTGEMAISIFQKEFQDDFIKAGAGVIIDTDEL